MPSTITELRIKDEEAYLQQALLAALRDAGNLSRYSYEIRSALGPSITIGAGSAVAGANATTKQVRKTADESVTSSTTLQNDDELKWAVGINEVWQWIVSLSYDGSPAGDLKVAWASPTGSSGIEQWIGFSQANVYTTRTIALGGTPTLWGAQGVNVDALLFGTGLVVVGASGDLQLQWAQAAGSGTATRVRTHSSLIAFRIS